MSQQRERDHYFHLMGRYGVPYPQASQLYSAARVHARITELACNRELTPRENGLAGSAAIMIARIAQQNAFAVKLDGDPRGYTVKLLLPILQGDTHPPHNTWGGGEEGYAIA